MLRLNQLVTSLEGNVELSKALTDLARFAVKSPEAFAQLNEEFADKVESDYDFVCASYVWYLVSIIGEASYLTLHTLYSVADKRRDVINTKHNVNSNEVIRIVTNGVRVLQDLHYIQCKYVIKTQSFYSQFDVQHTPLISTQPLLKWLEKDVNDEEIDLEFSSKVRALISLESLYRGRGIKAFDMKAKLNQFAESNKLMLNKLSNAISYDFDQAIMIGNRLISKHAKLYEADTLDLIQRDLSLFELGKAGLAYATNDKFSCKIDARERIYWSGKLKVAGVTVHNTLQNLSLSKGSIYLKDQDDYLTENGFIYLLNELSDLLGIVGQTLTERVEKVRYLLGIQWGLDEDYKVYTIINHDTFEDWLTVLDNVKIKPSKLPTLLATMYRLYHKEYSKLVASIDATASHLQVIATLLNSQQTALLCNLNGRDTINKVDILATKVLNDHAKEATGISDLFTTSKYIIMTCGYGKSSNNLIFDAIDETKLNGNDKVALLKKLQFIHGYDYRNNQDFATRLVENTINHVMETENIVLPIEAEALTYKDFVEYFRQVLQQAKLGVKPTHFTFTSMGREHTIACYEEVNTAFNKYRCFGHAEGLRALSSAVVHSYDSGILAEVSNLLVSQDLREYLPVVEAEIARRNVIKDKAIALLATEMYTYTPVRQMVKDISSLNDLQLIHLKQLLSVIPNREIVIMPNHDCFATHPNNCYQVLSVYKTVMSVLAETNSLLHTLNSLQIYTYDEAKQALKVWNNNYNMYSFVGKLTRGLANKPMQATLYAAKVMQSNYCLC